MNINYCIKTFLLFLCISISIFEIIYAIKKNNEKCNHFISLNIWFLTHSINNILVVCFAIILRYKHNITLTRIFLIFYIIEYLISAIGLFEIYKNCNLDGNTTKIITWITSIYYLTVIFYIPENSLTHIEDTEDETVINFV